MKIEPFALERWLTRHELHVKYDIAESGILPLTMADLLAFEPEDRRAETLILEGLARVAPGAPVVSEEHASEFGAPGEASDTVAEWTRQQQGKPPKSG